MGDQDSNTQVITIDSEISRILGLEDNFDLDPDEYLQLVRAKLVEYDILAGSKNITPEQQEEQRILASKVREIREQKREGNIKYNTGKVGKKINTDAFFNRKPEETKEPEKRIVDPSKLLPGTEKTGEIVKGKTQRVDDLKKEKPKEENKELTSILSILDSILNTLKNQFKFNQKKTEEDRKQKETDKRKKKEEGLEKGFSMVKSAVKKMLAPFQDILDRIKKFFFFTFLGKMFTDLMNWLGDPKNKKKVEVLGRFLKDWWPLLLGAYLMFASPLGLFIRGSLKMIGGLTSQILKLLPRLLNLSKNLATSAPARSAGSALLNIAKSPFVWFPAAVAGTAALANEVTGQRKAARVQTENAAKVQAGKALEVKGTDTMGDKTPSVGNIPTTSGLIQGAFKGGLVNRNRIGSYADGAEIEDGYGGIDSNTGVSITGAGKDTQLIAARPGEVVLTPEDSGHIFNKTGFDVYDYVKNRKPSYTDFGKIKTTGGIPLANIGGILGFKDGGVVGYSPQQIKSYQTIYSLARKHGATFPQLTAAMAMNETGWMRHIAGNNPFNQRGVDGKFMNYRTLEDSVTHHIRLWDKKRPGMKNIAEFKDPNEAFAAIVPAYAPPSENNPEEYKNNVRRIMKDMSSYAPKLETSKPKDTKKSNDIWSLLRNMLGMSKKQDGGLVGGLDSFGRSIFENVGGSVGKTRGRETGLPGGGWFGEKLGEKKGRNIYEQLTSPLRRQGGGLIKMSPLPNELGGGGGGTDAITEQAKVKTFGSAINGFLFGESKNIRDPQRYKGGGSVKENTGMNIPGATADRQLTMLQPGEYVLPVDTVNRLGASSIDHLVAATDSNSKPAKLGFRNKSIDIKPPPNKLNNAIVAPPIKTSAGGQMKGSGTLNAQDVYHFSPVLETSFFVRKMHVDMYGILD